MTINELKYFIVACDSKSIRKAAKKLFISPQGLGKSIDSLEEELGCRLLSRSFSGVEMTKYGQVVYYHSKLILESVEQMEKEIDYHIESESKTPLKVAAANGVIDALGPKFILQFKTQYPNINTIVKTLSDQDVENAVYNGDMDIGLTLGPVDDTRFDADLIKTFKLMLLVNRNNPLFSHDSVSYKDLRNEKIILVEDVFKAHHTFIANCRKAGFEPDIIMGINELAHAYKYVYQDYGVSYSVDFALNDIDREIVKAIPLSDGDNDWSIHTITKKDSSVPNIAREFKSFVLSAK